MIQTMIKQCSKCDISIYRNHIVNGSGNLRSDLMFIGEAPGYHEDKSGVPFVGNSGNLLSNMLHLIGLDRTMVYITNIIKCRPPSNRTPNSIEISNCRIHLDKELELVNPKIIVLLGGVALNSYFKTSGLNIGPGPGPAVPPENNVNDLLYQMYALTGDTALLQLVDFD